MKKRNILLLTLTCILSLCLFAGLMVYAFQLQTDKDFSDLQNSQPTVPTQSPEKNDSEVDDNIPPAAEGDTSGKVNNDAITTNPLDNNIKEDNVGKTDTETDIRTPSEVNNSLPTKPEDTANKDANKAKDSPIVLAFAGDINLDENSKPVAKYDSEKKGILGGIAKELVDEMNGADIMMLNNEFPYSTRGVKTPDKSYTFRADPSRIKILEEMGVDIVSLANNHALDFGRDALEDTFTTLEATDIEYVGAGRNMDRAKAPIYFTVQDKTIAFVAASRVVFAMDWYATESRMGMVGTYDPTIILESVKEAKENSDYVVIYLHWGVERKDLPEEYQRLLATRYIDAGADAVIGCHPHVLQGLEYYKGKPIAYSLGNYWFNNSTRDAGLLKLYLDPDSSVRVQMIPTLGSNTYTSPITKEADRKKYFDYLESISFNVMIDEEGFITEKAGSE